MRPESSNIGWICPSAWNGAYYTHDGKFNPCCRSTFFWDIEPGQDPETLPQLKQMREQMLSGAAPKECAKCSLEEEAGLLSKRLVNLRLHTDVSHALQRGKAPPPMGDVGIELGNTCNLRCITCNPSASTAWNRDAEAGGYTRKPVYRADPASLRPHLPYLHTLQFLGGETFLSPQLEEQLALVVKEGHPENVYLNIFTNCTVFPKAEVLGHLARFGMVHIHCSIDATEERNEYIRFPASWKATEEVLRQWIEWRRGRFNVDVFLEPTVSAYSYPGLPELLLWWERTCRRFEAGELVKNISFGFVSEPDFQSVHVLSKPVRDEVAARLRALPGELPELAQPALAYSETNDHSHLRPILRRWTESLDHARNLSAARSAPEIFRD